MSDAALQISLDGPLADDVRAAAKARGLSPEDYVRQQLESDVAAEAYADDLDWEEDIRRLEEPGDSIPLDEAFDELKRTVAELRAKK